MENITTGKQESTVCVCAVDVKKKGKIVRMLTM